MEGWIREGLSKVLDFEVPDDLINYIMSINSVPEFNDYMKTLLDFDNPKHRSFFVEIVHKMFPNGASGVAKPKKKISKNKQPQKDFVTVEEPLAEDNSNNENEGKNKKKTKFVNLYSKEGENAQVIMLKGRHWCDCEAVKHELINNCINCGRIVCTQEGSGPCMFCGNLVCTPEEEKQINSNTKSGAKLQRSLLDRKAAKGYEAALAQVKRLVDIERSGEKQTKIIDDDNDYFNTNSVWLSKEEKEKLEQYRQELHEQKHASRLTKKMTFDFAGRQIVEENTLQGEVDLDRINSITSGEKPNKMKEFHNDMLTVSADRDVAPGVFAPILQFDSSVEKVDYAEATKKPVGSSRSRIQDAMIQEMSDTGKCLSMHQPWASLLVEGIKLHEGRTWYTNHRGRLWIASTAKPPDQEVVKSLEEHYRVFYPEKNFKFPSFYPTGCLLGCVNVDDCLTQEEYLKQFPDGESDSPYVFICSNPVSLRLRFPIKGQHKIYQLEKTIHIAAQKCIQNMGKTSAESGVV